MEYLTLLLLGTFILSKKIKNEKHPFLQELITIIAGVLIGTGTTLCFIANL